MTRLAIAQIAMRWSTQENLQAILAAIDVAHAEGARICAFSELAVTGFHREIAREAVPQSVLPAIDRLQARCAQRRVAIAVGAPTFGVGSFRYDSHLLISEAGELVATISKQGLTEPEATFFQPGTSRPIGRLQGLDCSAVICREVGDIEAVSRQLPPDAVDIVFVPGALRQNPGKPRSELPEYVRDIQRLAATTRAFAVHTNWPNALNRPEESVDGGGSTVVAPDGTLLFRLPAQAAGVGIFALGESSFHWHPEP